MACTASRLSAIVTVEWRAVVLHPGSRDWASLIRSFALSSSVSARTRPDVDQFGCSAAGVDRQRFNRVGGCRPRSNQVHHGRAASAIPTARSSLPSRCRHVPTGRAGRSPSALTDAMSSRAKRRASTELWSIPRSILFRSVLAARCMLCSSASAMTDIVGALGGSTSRKRATRSSWSALHGGASVLLLSAAASCRACSFSAVHCALPQLSKVFCEWQHSAAGGVILHFAAAFESTGARVSLRRWSAAGQFVAMVVASSPVPWRLAS